MVEFSALVEVPVGAGTVVAAEWDFEGAGDFPEVAPFDNEESSYASKTLTTAYAFPDAGNVLPGRACHLPSAR